MAGQPLLAFANAEDDCGLDAIEQQVTAEDGRALPAGAVNDVGAEGAIDDRGEPLRRDAFDAAAVRVEQTQRRAQRQSNNA